MSVPKRDPSLQIALYTLTIQPAPAGKYGLSVRGCGPPAVSDVVAGSAAEQGGLRQGDFIVKINNVDVFKDDADEIVPLLNQFGGRSLSVCVARPRPVPTTDVERRRALIAVQSKLDKKAIDAKLEQSRYANTVGGAQLSAQGVLEALKTSGDEPEDQQTVLLELYDSDSLPSPPDSSGEEQEDEEEEGGGAPRVNPDDPLLDFSRIDSLTHVPRKLADKEGQVNGAQPPKHPLPVVGLLPSNANPSNRLAGAGQGSSPTKSPAKATQFFPPASQSSASSSKVHTPLTHTMSDVTAGSKSSSDVILRQRKKDVVAGTGGIFAPQGPNQRIPAEVEVGGVASLDVACRELPNCVREWSSANVQVWLQQVNQSLHSLYSANFSNHDITGPSLLRLNEDRLTDMGITQQKHRYLLASSIATLRVKQESLEIREIVGSEEVDTDDDELEMTYL